MLHYLASAAATSGRTLGYVDTTLHGMRSLLDMRFYKRDASYTLFNLIAVSLCRLPLHGLPIVTVIDRLLYYTFKASRLSLYSCKFAFSTVCTLISLHVVRF